MKSKRFYVKKTIPLHYGTYLLKEADYLSQELIATFKGWHPAVMRTGNSMQFMITQDTYSTTNPQKQAELIAVGKIENFLKQSNYADIVDFDCFWGSEIESTELTETD